MIFQRGERVHGRVLPLPFPPGQTGLFVDLGDGQIGFVDVLNLPEDPQRWPAAGRDGFFEVLQYQRGQVRLFPLDADMRSETNRVWQWSADEWRAIVVRHPVGSTVAGTVESVWEGEREYVVKFGDVWSIVDFDGVPPTAGDEGAFVVAHLLDATRRVLIAPSTAHTA
jgi:hypothetical protein